MGQTERSDGVYRENCVAEVAVHVAHMLRHRRDLLGRHSFGSPWVVQTADGEERELEEASGATIYAGTKRGQLIKEQIERSDRIGRYIGVGNQQGTAYINNFVNTEMSR